MMRIPLNYIGDCLKVSCTNPNLVIDGNGVFVKSTGEYQLVFACINEFKNKFNLSSSNIDHNLVNYVYVDFNVTGSQEVAVPLWDDNSTVLSYDFSGHGASNPLVVTAKIPVGATIIAVYNADGLNPEYTVNGDIVTINAVYAGYYQIKYIINSETSYWADGDTNNIKIIAFRARYLRNVPTWADGSVQDKIINYSVSGNSASFVLDDNVIAGCTDPNAVISGNTITVSKPGTYVICFNFKTSAILYGWKDNYLYTERTLTLHVTGGEKVELPAWSDGTTADKYVSMGAANKSVVTYKLPEGVTVSVASTSTPATVSISGGVATVTASAVGHYTVNFKIDTTKYVWADNSVSEVKTLKFHVTAKQIIDYPTWADGGIDIKYFDGSVVGSSNVELGIKYDANKVVAELTDKDGNVIAGAVNGQTVSIPAGSGLYTLNFTLKDPANNVWENGSTGPRTLQAGIMNRCPPIRARDSGS